MNKQLVFFCQLPIVWQFKCSEVYYVFVLIGDDKISKVPYSSTPVYRPRSFKFYLGVDVTLMRIVRIMSHQVDGDYLFSRIFYPLNGLDFDN